VVDEEGVATIDDTRMKVSHLVSKKHAYGWSPAELHFQHTHLSLGQIHSALAYYWDHKDEIDSEIEEALELEERLRAERDETELEKRLRAKGLIE
jgi:uncharacterized protein (DUF433 family)